MTTDEPLDACVWNEVPNLDGMSTKELLLFWVQHRLGLNAHELFPDSDTVMADRLVAHSLSEYALTKLAAVRARLRGDIEFAFKWEMRCDDIYRDLPAKARW